MADCNTELHLLVRWRGGGEKREREREREREGEKGRERENTHIEHIYIIYNIHTSTVHT